MRPHQSIHTLNSIFRISLIGLDCFCLTALHLLILKFRFAESYLDYFSPSALLIQAATTLLTLSIVGAYNRMTDMCSLRFFSEFLLASVFNAALLLTLIYFLGATSVARANLGSVLLLFPLLAITYRRSISLSAQKDFVRRTLYVIGAGDIACDFYRTLERTNWQHHTLFFDPTGKRIGQHLVASDPRSPLLHDNPGKHIRENPHSIETIVLAERERALSIPLLAELLEIHFNNIPVQTVDSFFSTQWKMTSLSSLGPTWAFSEGFQLSQSMTFERAKRCTDLCLALTCASLCLPVLLLLPLLIRLDSPGPIIFRQTRIGRNRRPFTLYKFRTMRTGSESGDTYTRAGDTRVTRLGQLLRKLRLDELPQLWNVIRGDMSFIGPRAEWDKLVERYEKSIPCYHFRHMVKPGITGWAQVNYPYGQSEQDTVEKLKYDLYYVRHCSLLLDLSICIKTIYIIFSRKGL